MPGSMPPLCGLACMLAGADRRGSGGAQGALQQAATDPLTGTIDMDKILTGTSASERTARAQLAQELSALLLRARPVHVPSHAAACAVTLLDPSAFEH